MFFLLLSLFACGLDPVLKDTGDSVSDEVDRGDSVDFLVYPTADMNQILVFTGHGGTGLQPNSEVRTAWESDGWRVREDATLPASLQPFRLIVFVDMGGVGEPADNRFTAAELEALGKAIDRGTRLLFLQEVRAGDQCGSEAVSQVITGWSVPFAFDQGLPGGAVIQNFTAINTSSQAVAQVETVTMRDPCTLTAGGTWLVRSESEHATMSQFRPGNAGDLIFVGDVDVLRDPVVDPENNHNLIVAQNLARVTP